MRSGFLDGLRGTAVVWMIIFHAAYDMRMLGFVDWDFSSGFWFAFPRVIAFTFLFCVGMALNFNHVPRINWVSLRKRSLKLALAATIISLATYLAFPQAWIYFGTLHCILVGSLLGALLVNQRKLAGLMLVSILVLQYLLGYDIKFVSSIVQRPSLDFIPIYPWFWAILLGIMLGPYLSKSKQLSALPVPGWLNYLGKHSLRIYLIHQPLIYGTLWAVRALI